MGMTLDEVGRLDVPEPARVAAAAAPLAGWLAEAPADAVRDGLVAAADPEGALHALARLLDGAVPALAPDAVTALLRLLGGSPAIAAAFVAEEAAWPALLAAVLAEPSRDAAAHAAALAALGVATAPLARAELQARLRTYRRREMARIGGRDLLRLGTVDDTVRELSALADAIVAAALAPTRARLAAEWGGDASVPFVVLGMGKLGGGELNYSSDIDLVYVYAQDGDHPGGRSVREFFVRLGEEVTRAIGEVTPDGLCFRVDLRLRPGGNDAAVAVSLPATLSYYEAFGQTWERAVWLKARPIAGDLALGAQLLDELGPFVYRRYLDFGTLEDLKAMKRRVDASLRDAAARARNVKLGRGGIRGVEFWVQAQQLVHGGKDARLRDRSTLGGLVRLADAGYADRTQCEALAAAYRFLRDVEHKLQMVRWRQTQAIPDDPEEERRLARRMGFRDAAAFWAAHARVTDVVDAAFQALFHGAEEARRRDERPELGLVLDELEQEDATCARLAALGFQDCETASRDLLLLRDGPPHARSSPRRRTAIAALAPSLLGEIAASAAPDRALTHLATFVATIGARTSYLHLLLENPGLMRLLVRLFASSELLSTFFLRHPELLDSLVRADLVRVTRTKEDLAAELTARIAAAPDVEAELDTLRRFRREEFLRIGVHDIEGELDAAGVSAQLSAVAEACTRMAVAMARGWALGRLSLPDVPATEGFAVVAMGKLGGRELGYHSDLDLIFVHDAGDADWWRDRTPPGDLFTRIAQRTISVLQTPTAEGVAYRIDTRLRPSGNQGALVTSLEAFEAYHRTSAALWERQALVKARVVSGPAGLRERLEAAIAGFVYGRGLTGEEAAALRDMRARIAEERGAQRSGEVNIKTDPGGLVDVEFAVQMLQLRHGHAEPRVRRRGTRRALEALAACGLLDPASATALREGWDFLRVLEGRLRIERDQPVEAFAADPATLASLAQRMGFGGGPAEAAAALQATHRRHREAIRAAFTRVFDEAVRA